MLDDPSVALTVLVLAQLFHVLAIRSERESLFAIGLLGNPQLLGAVLVTVLLQLMVIYVPVFNPIFRTMPLPAADLILCFMLSAPVLLAVEIEKWLARRGWLYRGEGRLDSKG